MFVPSSTLLRVLFWLLVHIPVWTEKLSDRYTGRSFIRPHLRVDPLEISALDHLLTDRISESLCL
jgi:hypothetical protein